MTAEIIIGPRDTKRAVAARKREEERRKVVLHEYAEWIAGIQPMTGEQLRAWRRLTGLSAPRAAALMGVEQTTLWRMETGKAKIKPCHNILARAILDRTQPFTFTMPRKENKMSEPRLTLKARGETP